MIINETTYGVAGSKIAEMAYGVPAPYCLEAKKLFVKMNSVGSSVSELRKNQINNTIQGLKDANVWTSLDFLFVWAANSRGAALIDWKNPERQAQVFNAYSGDFLADGYFKGNGTNFRIKLNYNPFDGGSYNFTYRSNSFGCYVVDHVDETKIEMGYLGTSNIGHEVGNTITTYALNGRNSNLLTGGIQNFNNMGLIAAKRSRQGNWELTKNGYDMYGVVLGASKENSSASPNLNNASWNEFCRTISGANSLFSTKKHAYSFAGSGDIDLFTLHNILDKNYLTPLGVTPTKRIIFNGNSYTDAGTYQKRVIANGGYTNIDILSRGIVGHTTTQMLGDAYTSVFNKAKTFLAKDVLFVWELTNDMANNSSNATTCYNNLLAYLRVARSMLPNAKIVVATMMPRKAADVNNTNRQNDSNLNDTSTLNGMIRVNLVATGLCDAICDTASDPTMGIYSNGVAGVGEKNTTYYSTDEIHPTTAGYQLLADNYITSSINAFL